MSAIAPCAYKLDKIYKAKEKNQIQYTKITCPFLEYPQETGEILVSYQPKSGPLKILTLYGYML